jgi:U3 small nucleolar RNA-associated protein 25
LQNDLLTVLTSYRDLYVTRSNIEGAPSVREATTLHVLNHISK